MYFLYSEITLFIIPIFLTLVNRKTLFIPDRKSFLKRIVKIQEIFAIIKTKEKHEVHPMKKKDKKWKFPKRRPLTYLLLILSVIVLFLAIFIPIQYVEYYNQNKVVPFETETKDVDVTHGSLSSLPDFNLLVTCTDYIDKKDTEDKQNQSSAKFRVSAYKNDQSDEKKVGNIKVKLAMCSNWIGVNRTYQFSSALTLYESLEKAQSNYRSATISGLPDLPVKGKLPFIHIDSIPLYIYVSYNTEENGKSKSHHYILKMNYNDYIEGATGGIID